MTTTLAGAENHPDRHRGDWDHPLHRPVMRRPGCFSCGVCVSLSMGIRLRFLFFPGSSILLLLLWLLPGACIVSTVQLGSYRNWNRSVSTLIFSITGPASSLSIFFHCDNRRCCYSHFRRFSFNCFSFNGSRIAPGLFVYYRFLPPLSLPREELLRGVSFFSTGAVFSVITANSSFSLLPFGTGR